MSVEARGLRVDLGTREVIRGIDLHAADGEFHVIAGPNGAGKSTLLRALAHLVPARAGSVSVDGNDLATLAAKPRAALVGYVPQQGHLDYPFTVREVVEMGRYARSSERSGASSMVELALADTHLTDLAHRPVTRLSGGERQRVLIARSLSQDPRVLLLDEPTASLDLGQAFHILRLLRRKAGSGRVVVAVMHDLETASRVADRITLMEHGEVLATGPPRDVLTSERLSGAFGARVRVRWDDDGARLQVEANENG